MLVFAAAGQFIEQEIALWDRVEFIDFNLHLFFSTATINNQSLVLEEAKNYLQTHKRTEYTFMPLGKVWNSELRSDPSQDQFGCLIEIRKNLIFTNTGHVASIPPTEKMKLALLVPTLNSVTTSDPPIKSFLLKSLHESLLPGDFEKFMISIYLAFDEGDAVFDDPKSSSIIDDFEREFPAFRFRGIKMYKTHWLTFIWNRLFVIAYREGNDLFLQINDDVQLLNKGWLQPTIKLLQNASVVGLNDHLWNCKLFTQALVGRAHYERFRGFFFPPGIKDWFSDNWITNVYGPKQSKCSSSAQIKNSNIKTRYQGCRKFRL